MFARHQNDETQIVARALDELARTPAHGPFLPDPSFIWWKAQLLRRRDAEREASAPIEVGDRVHIGAAILGAIALAAGAWDRLPSLGFTPATGLTIVGGIVILLSVVAAAALGALRER